MPNRFHKYKLLLDENMSHRDSFPTLNQRFDVKHIAADYNKSSLPDPKVYELSKSEKRLLVTYNIKDFVGLAKKSQNTGIIGVSPNLTLDQIDKKLTSILTKASEKELLGKMTIVSGES